MEERRWLGLGAAILLHLLARALDAQFTALQTFEGSLAGARFGAAVAQVGDLDGDGVDDLAIGLPLADVAGVDAGQVRLYSGATGGLIATINGLAAGDEFGSCICAMGDLDGDGRADFAVGAPLSDAVATNAGQVRVFAGPNGGLLATLNGSSAFDEYGRSVASIADIDGDMRRELVVGAPKADHNGDDFGRVFVYTGFPFTLHYNLVGDFEGDELGASVAGAGDVDGDGVEDLIAGAPLADAQGSFTNSGMARIYSGATGAAIHDLIGSSAVDLFGSAVAGLGDLNGDGRSEVAVGARLADAAGVDSGSVKVFSGLNYAVLHDIPGQAASDQCGTSVSSAGDFDGDGTPDFAVGSPNADGVGTDSGRVRVFSGVSGALLITIDGPSAGSRLGSSLSGGADFNVDGLDDLVVGAPDETQNQLVGAGRVRVYTLIDPAIIGRYDGVGGEQLGESIDHLGDVNGDGIPDFLAGARLADVNGVDSGRALVLSGAGGILHVIPGGAAGDEMGVAVAGLGDIDQDGRPDFAVGSYRYDISATVTDAGLVGVYSGATGALIRSHVGEAAQDQFGFCLAAAGDLDADGVGDYLVGAPRHDRTGAVDAGRVYAYSGATGTFLFGVDGVATSDQFGYSVAGVGDLNGDGVPDLAVGARLADNAGLTNTGRVYVRSGAAGAPLFDVLGTQANEQFGYAVAAAGDVNFDGVPDIVAGAPFYATPGTDAGRVRILSGAGGTVLRTIDGGAANTRFGLSVAGIGDLDADGFDDVAVGLPQSDAGGTNVGAVKVYSGETGALIYTHVGDDPNDELGYDVARAGDRDGDGFPEILVSARLDDDGGVDAGSVRVLSPPHPPINYPGTREDLFLSTGIAPALDRVQDILEVHPGNFLLVHWDSFNGTFDLSPPVLLGQLFTTGSPPSSPPGFPAIHVDVALVPGPAVVYDGNQGPFGPQFLPPAGITLGFTAPSGLAGKSFIFQAIAVSVQSKNHIFAASHAHEIRFLP